MDSHSRASKAEQRSLRDRRSQVVMDRKLQTMTKKLESTMMNLFHCRTRAEAAERLGLASSRLKLRTEGSLTRWRCVST